MVVPSVLALLSRTNFVSAMYLSVQLVGNDYPLQATYPYESNKLSVFSFGPNSWAKCAV